MKRDCFKVVTCSTDKHATTNAHTLLHQPVVNHCNAVITAPWSEYGILKSVDNTTVIFLMQDNEEPNLELNMYPNCVEQWTIRRSPSPPP